ncbi:MAG TPA: DUF1499 domain-containing protein [Pyrinomonadaceae bacterium]
MNILKILGIVAGAATVGIAGLAVANLGNVAETTENHQEENLRQRKYKTNLQSFIAELEKLIPMLTSYGQNWKFVSAAAAENSGVVKAEIPVVVFTDDLEIKAEYDAETGETTVNIRSASRVGNSDFGENRRHLLQILRALDEKFLTEN